MSFSTKNNGISRMYNLNLSIIFFQNRSTFRRPEAEASASAQEKVNGKAGVKLLPPAMTLNSNLAIKSVFLRLIKTWPHLWQWIKNG